MILKGGARADGADLAEYLTSTGSNERVHVLEMNGFGGRDLRTGLRLAEMEAEQSQGSKPFYHGYVAPAIGETMTREQQLEAVAILERHLGFEGLPRAIIAHDKAGRETHLHVVWSRFDASTGRLRRDDFTRRKHVAANIEISERFGFDLLKNPFAADAETERLPRAERRSRSHARTTHAEAQQEPRSADKAGARRIRITALWRATDNGRTLRSALEEAGYSLATGSRRGFVIVDQLGEIHSLARQIDGVRAKDVAARLADIDPGAIPTADSVVAAMRQARQDQRQAVQAREPSEKTEQDIQDLFNSPERLKSDPGYPARLAALTAGWDVKEQPGKSNTPRMEPYPTGSPAAEPQPRKGNSPGQVANPDNLPDAAGILDALTRNHSTFTRQDLARLVDRHTGGGGREPWMQRSGGFETLPDEQKAAAERSYAAWAVTKPESARRFGLSAYVGFVQAKQAEQDKQQPERVAARQGSQAAFDRLLAEVEASPNLVRLGPDGSGRDRFTSRQMLETELRMEADAAVLASRSGHEVRASPAKAAPSHARLGGDQRLAFEHITGKGDIALVIGFAGTGKSTMLGAAREAWEASGFRVRGTALSGLAADGLSKDAGIKSRTLHSLLHQLATVEDRAAELARLDAQIGDVRGRTAKARRYRTSLVQKRDLMAHDLDASRLTARDIVVVDEAAMVGSRQIGTLLTAARQAGAKVVLVGDAEQLQAIEAGAAFRALRDRHGAAEIREIRRQRQDWQRLATRELATGRTVEALERYQAQGMTHAAVTRNKAKAALVASWSAVRRQRPDASQIILAYTRADVADLNRTARAAYAAEGRLGQDHSLLTATGATAFASGDRLYFTKNDTRLGVKNGTLGTVASIVNGQVTVTIDGGGTVGFAIKDYNHIAHGYAATVHKSQGVTVDRAHVLASRFMDRHAAYVGMSRHRDRVDLHYGSDEFRDFVQLSRRLGRDGSKDSTLDYVTRARNGEGSEGFVAQLRALYPRRRSATPEPPPAPVVQPSLPAAARPPVAPTAPSQPAPKDEKETRLQRAKRLLRQVANDIRRSREWDNTPD